MENSAPKWTLSSAEHPKRRSERPSDAQGGLQGTRREIKNLRFSSQMLEALRKIPRLEQPDQAGWKSTKELTQWRVASRSIEKEPHFRTSWLAAPSLTSRAGELTIDSNQNVTGKITWQPKESFFSPRFSPLFATPGRKERRFPCRSKAHCFPRRSSWMNAVSSHTRVLSRQENSPGTKAVSSPSRERKLTANWRENQRQLEEGFLGYHCIRVSGSYSSMLRYI